MVLTTKTNNEHKPVAGLRRCRLTGLSATSLKGQWKYEWDRIPLWCIVKQILFARGSIPLHTTPVT